MNGSGIALPCGNYICADDVDNWSPGTTDEEKLAIIQKMEGLMERAAGTHFYAKAFDVRVNGNDKNRLFLPLGADILAVSLISVWDIELETFYYTWNAQSVFIDLTGIGLTDLELRYKLSQVEARGIFPHGYNNVRVVGLYGKDPVPAWAKQVATILVRDHNDPRLYQHATLQSESIGNYSYSLGSGGIAQYPTGVVEADKWLRLFGRGKMIMGAP
jgi:hypothetical protein